VPTGEWRRFGELLRQHRIAADLTQEALAERAGLSARGIQDLERGVRSAPRMDTVRLLTDALLLGAEDRAAFRAAARTPPTPEAPAEPAIPRFTALPAQPTALIGRETHVAHVRQQLLRPDLRLLTLTGPAGAGKTRLALAVASDLQCLFDHGAVFVDLAPLGAPDLVVAKIAQALGVADRDDITLPENLRRYLRRKQLLLLLDNFEHVLPAAPSIAAVLETCPEIKVLVTSRSALHLRWEHEYLVPPLDLPNLTLPLDLGMVATTPSVALFAERARAVEGNFQLTEANARSVAEICVHLDGLPLAIELAAACMKTLLPHALLQRLRQRFELLVAGGADLPPRQRTLRATVDWSYDLLQPEEQALFRRLSVFAGGWTLESAETVCAGQPISQDAVAALLARLVDASLVVAEQRTATEATEARYRLLETLRQYAGEKLEQAGRTTTLHERHLDWFLALADQAEPELHGPRQVAWLNRLQAQEDNLRAALRWSVTVPEDERGLRLASSLCWFWFVRGRRSEGRAWLERLLAQARRGGAATATRAKALSAAGFLAHDQRDYGAARAFQDDSFALAQELGDTQAMAVALGRLGYLALHQRDFERARALLTRSLELYRDRGDDWGLAYNLNALGLVALRLADYASANRLFEESRALFRARGDMWGIAWTLRGLGQIALDRADYALAATLWGERLRRSEELGDPHATAYSVDYMATAARMQGDYAQAAALFKRSLAIWEDWGDRQYIAWTLHNMGDLALEQGDTTRARQIYERSLSLRRELDDRPAIATSLEGFAALAAALSQPQQALRLAGAATALHTSVAVPPSAVEQATLERWLSPIRATLGADAAKALADGAAMSLEEALVCALAVVPGGMV